MSDTSIDDTAATDDQTPAEPPATGDADGTEVDLAAEVEKWKALARKHEGKAKSNATAAQELEKLRLQSMTDQERAVEQARADARAETLREIGVSRVDDAVRVAVAGRTVDVDALLEGLDRSRFVDDDGQPDRDAIASWVDRVAPKPSEQAVSSLIDLGQGARGNVNLALNGDPLQRSLEQKLGITRT